MTKAKECYGKLILDQTLRVIRVVGKDGVVRDPLENLVEGVRTDTEILTEKIWLKSPILAESKLHKRWTLKNHGDVVGEAVHNGSCTFLPVHFG